MTDQRLGPYQLLSRLGAGGMGEVFLARLAKEEGFVKRLAVKRILPALAGQARFQESFAAEARLTADLNHPHIVQVTDFGREGEVCYLAMEYIEGCDLSTLLEACQHRNLAVDQDFTLGIGLACLRALGYAHGRNPPVVHGDVSPSNVMVGCQGEVKLTDFGLARIRQTPGEVCGKPAWMAPEVAMGQPPTHSSDQFGVGALLYTLLAGHPPHRALADQTQAIERARREVIRPLTAIEPDTHPGLARVIGRALSPEPAGRYPDAAEMEDQLARVATGLGCDTGPRTIQALVDRTRIGTRNDDPTTSARTLVAAGQPDPSTGGTPRSWLGWVGVAILTTGLGLGAWLWHPWSPAPPSPPIDPPLVPAGSEPRFEEPPPEEDGGLAAEDLDHRTGPADPRPRPRDPGRPGTTRPADPVGIQDAGVLNPPATDPPPIDEPASPVPRVEITSRQPLAWSLDGSEEKASALGLTGLTDGIHVLKVRVGQDLSAVLRLEIPEGPGPLGLAVSSKPFAILRIDGRPRGTTPLGGLALGSGTHRLGLAERGGARIEIQITAP